MWSDLHLGHANIIEYQDRPFFSGDAMDAQLWERWESVLEPDSVLVLVGDVAVEEGVCHAHWDRVRHSPGREKHLVIGNHDLTGLGELRAEGFDSVWSVMTLSGDPPLVWTHYPLREVPEGYVKHPRARPWHRSEKVRGGPDWRTTTNADPG